MHAADHEDGFTVVELMTVVLLIGILVSIAIPIYSGAVARAQVSTCFANQTTVSVQAEYYRARENTSAPTLQALVTTGYLKATPVCPSKGLYVWQSRRSGGNDTIACSKHYVSAASAALWSSGATTGDMTMIMGAWKAVAGGFSAGAGQNRALFGDPAWTDTTITTKMSLAQGSRGGGVFFRASNTKAGLNGYCFQIDPGAGNRFVLRKWVNGAEVNNPNIALVDFPKGMSVYNTPHDISITTVGSRIVVKVDGAVVVDKVDTSFASGQAGLRNWYGDASVGPISVTKAVP